MRCKHGWDQQNYGTCPQCEGDQALIEVANRSHSEEQYRVQIADLQRQLAEAKAEIEAMRPVVDAARYHERSVTFYSHGTSSDPYHCDVCRAYKVYEARKQP